MCLSSLRLSNAGGTLIAALPPKQCSSSWFQVCCSFPAYVSSVCSSNAAAHRLIAEGAKGRANQVAVGVAVECDSRRRYDHPTVTVLRHLRRRNACAATPQPAVLLYRVLRLFSIADSWFGAPPEGLRRPVSSRSSWANTTASCRYLDNVSRQQLGTCQQGCSCFYRRQRSSGGSHIAQPRQGLRRFPCTPRQAHRLETAPRGTAQRPPGATCTSPGRPAGSG